MKYTLYPIAPADRQIDQLVYDLYGLAEDEIALVEGAGGGSPIPGPLTLAHDIANLPAYQV